MEKLYNKFCNLNSHDEVKDYFRKSNTYLSRNLNTLIEFKKIDNSVLFGDGMLVEQVSQGFIEDCWLISVLLHLSTNENFIRSNITEINYHGHCIYKVVLYQNSQKKAYFVDDFFPFIKNSNKEYCAKIKNNIIWVALYEKAVALHFGGYDKIEQNVPKKGIEILCPFSYSEISYYNFDRFSFDDNKYFIVVSNNNSKKPFKKGHVYFCINNQHGVNFIEEDKFILSKECFIQRYKEFDEIILIQKYPNISNKTYIEKVVKNITTKTVFQNYSLYILGSLSLCFIKNKLKIKY